MKPATLADLHGVEGKAELIDGMIVRYPHSGCGPARPALEIAISLDDHAKRTGVGEGYTGGLGYALGSPLANGRQSFQADASYHVGPHPTNPLDFMPWAPTFAVEVRDEGDYGPSAEAEMEAKRADYFAAGTLAVWDVDTLSRRVALHFRDPKNPAAVFGPGQFADAGPAVPGWRVAVDELFR